MRRIFPMLAAVVLALAVVGGLTVKAAVSEAADSEAVDLVVARGIPGPVLLGGGKAVAEVPADTVTPSVGPFADGSSAASSTTSTSGVPSLQTPPKPKKPKPATRERKARNVPERPRDTHTGKRIVYDKALMTVWLMDKNDEVVARYPVVGRWDRPAKGTYRIFSKSPMAWNPNSKVSFAHMVRFTYGPDTKSPIGFHAIPRYSDGSRMHPVSALGLPIATGGCIRMSDKAAEEVYKFMKVGDLVVVLPSP